MTGCSWLFPNLFVQHLHQQHDSSMDDPQMRIFSLHWTQPAMLTMLWFSWFMNLYGFSLMVPGKNGYETYRMTDPMRVWCSRAHQLLLHCFKINPQHSWWCYSPHQGGGKVLIFGSSVVPNQGNWVVPRHWGMILPFCDEFELIWCKFFSKWPTVCDFYILLYRKMIAKWLRILDELFFDLDNGEVK